MPATRHAPRGAPLRAPHATTIGVVDDTTDDSLGADGNVTWTVPAARGLQGRVRRHLRAPRCCWWAWAWSARWPGAASSA